MNARTFTITLPEKAIDAIKRRVEAGQYASTDDAMLAAVDALLDAESEHGGRIEAIRKRVQKSLDDPRPSLNSAEIRTHLNRLYRQHRG